MIVKGGKRYLTLNLVPDTLYHLFPIEADDQADGKRPAAKPQGPGVDDEDVPF